MAEQPDLLKAWVASTARWRRFKPGEFVYLAGDKSDGLYGLAAGAVEVSFPLVGAEPVSIYWAEVGFWIGESAELSDDRRLVSLMSVQHAELLHIPGGAIRQLLERQPSYWSSFYQLSYRNSTLLLNLLGEALSLSVRARVCRRLLALSQRAHLVALTHEQLAAILGLARGTVRAELSKLAAIDAIDLGYGQIRIVNRDALIALKDEQ